ncbi:GerMN domain-containing protein [Nocardioides cavernaquae]|uniref:GerMN domain-containing protein n=1 Tax=Nocardioides cavernaquae TaxID=2321396 RepID=A0A3A5H7K6_9ACTN|nr:GerMN domain-containing protein [Nocardioides cavernaquae]RJS46636.1 hypothetical protein D4739_10685 [Nocardioides cavernaquae]
MSTLRDLRVLLAGLLLTSVATGCVRLPDSGQVRRVPEERPAVLEEGIPYLPPGPSRGEGPRDVVRGFLDAMMASPLQLSTAREFLTEDGAQAWRPQRRVVTYTAATLGTVAGTAEIDLGGAQWIDARGRWRGELPARQRVVQLPLVVEDGEWRIDQVPDAMLVPETWFAEHYQQVSLDFLDPTTSIIVPEPVFVPRGEQMATALVRGLIAGPPDAAGAGLVSLLRGAHLIGGAVTIEDGVASVALDGDITATTEESRELLAAQLAWTLRQVPIVSALRVRLGSAPLALKGGLTEFPVGIGAAYDPRSAGAADDLFGLRNGHLVGLVGGSPVPATGPLGTGPRLRDVAVSLPGSMAAGVRSSGRDLLVAPVDDETGSALKTPIRGAEDLAHPAWDSEGRLWVLDRRRTGAVVSVLVDNRVTEVEVPGVSGEAVVDLLVSRDGTRLVAAVRRVGGDEVRISRLDWHTGRVRASAAQQIARLDSSGTPIRDLAWRSPTELLVLSALSTRLAEVRTVSVDGSPARVRDAGPPELVRADVRRLVASPADRALAWAETADGVLVGVGPIGSATPPAGAQQITYVG